MMPSPSSLAVFRQDGARECEWEIWYKGGRLQPPASNSDEGSAVFGLLARRYGAREVTVTTRFRQPSALGRRITELRGNDTQREVAHRGALSLDLLKSIEQGRRTPTLRTLQKLAAALRTTVADLVRDV